MNGTELEKEHPLLLGIKVFLYIFFGLVFTWGWNWVLFHMGIPMPWVGK